MTIAHPLRDSAAWGRVVLGGSVLPGVLTDISVPARKFNWNVQKGFGISMVSVFGSVDLLTGISFTHFLNLASDGSDDWSRLETCMRTLLSGWPNNVQIKPKSLPCIYPALQFLGSRRMHLTEFAAPVPASGERVPQFYTITLQEDVPDRRPPTGPAEPAKINGPPTPKTQWDAFLLTLFSDVRGS